MIVAIEGMDGVGKTTIAKYIAEKYNYKYIKEPLSEVFNKSQDEVLKLSQEVFKITDERIIAWYLALGDIFALSKYKFDNIVMDRHVLLNYFWNGTDFSEEIFVMQQRMFGKPDFTILLYASNEERKQRIINRDPNDTDLKCPNMWIDGYDKMIKYLEDYDYSYELLDTNNSSIDETKEMVDVIMKKLQL